MLRLTVLTRAMTEATSSHEGKNRHARTVRAVILLLCTKYLHCHSERGEQIFHCQNPDSFLYWSA
jgi:hypothetical protein